jgi:hypothetical protein
MGLLSKASKTTSYQSWQDIDGNAVMLVQRRTGDGLAKNRSAAHKLMYSAADLFPFRIILLEGLREGLGYNATSEGARRGHDGDARMKDATKYVLAAGQTKVEILKDWQDMKNFADVTGIVAATWNETYNHIQYQKRHHVSDTSSVASTARGGHPSPLDSPQPSKQASPVRPHGPGGEGSPQPHRGAALEGESAPPAPESPTVPLGQSRQSRQDSENNALMTQQDSLVSAQALSAGPSSHSSFSAHPQKPLKYKEAAENPKNSAHAFEPCSPMLTVNRADAEEASGGNAIAPPSPADLWWMRVCRVWDGTAPFATLLVVVLLVAATVGGVSCLPLAVGLPVFVGSLLSVDPSSRSSAARTARLAHRLRGSPVVRFFAHRQQTTNALSTAVLLHYALSVVVGESVTNGLELASCAIAAALVCVTALRGRLTETRASWHSRLEQMEFQAMRAVADGKSQAESAVNNMSMTRETASNASFGNASISGGAASGEHAGAISTEPSMSLVTIAEMPQAARRALELIAGEGGVKWSKPALYNGVECRTASVPWVKSPAAKFQFTMPGVRAMSVYRCLYDDPTGVKGRASYAFQIDDSLAERYLLKRGGQNEAYWYTAVNSRVPGFAGRDLVTKMHPFTLLSPEMRSKFKLPDHPGFVYAAECYSGPDAPPPNPPFVRATMHRFCIIAQDLPDNAGCLYTSVVSVDPSGYVPSFAVALTSRDSSKRMRILESFVRSWERTHAVGDPLPYEGVKIERKKAKKDPVHPVIAKGQKKQQEQEVARRTPSSAAIAGIVADGAMAETPEIVVKAFELINEPGWADKGEKDGCTWEAKMVPYCRAEAGRFKIFMPGVSAANLCSYINDDPDYSKGDKSLTYKFDAVLESRTLVKRNAQDPLVVHVHTKFKSPMFGIAPRDFSMRLVQAYFLNDAEKERFRIGSPGCDVFVTAGANDDAAPENKKYTRATAHVYGLVASDRCEGSGCDVVMVMCNDLGGKLPVSIVNGVAGAQMDKLLKMHSMFAELQVKDGRKPSPPPTRPTVGMQPPEAEFAEPEPERDAAAAADERDERHDIDPKTKAHKKDPAAAAAADSGLDPCSLRGGPRALAPRQGPLPEPFQKAIRLWREPDWKQRAAREGAVQRTTPSPFCPKDALWMQVFIEDAVLEDVDRALNDDDVIFAPKEAPYKYDRLIDKRFVTEVDVQERRMILHSLFTSPSRLVSQRDTVTTFYWREVLSAAHQAEVKDIINSATGRVFTFAAVEVPPEKIPPPPKFTRGNTHVFSLWAVEQRNGVDLHMVMSFDPQGSVPATLVNAANAEQLEKILLMRQLVLTASRERPQREE